MTHDRADVVIVGAGLAGLVAARELVNARTSVIVLEARDRVGGRLLDHSIGEGNVIELGGQWIGPTQDRIAALARELEVPTFPTYDEGDHILHFGGKLARYRGIIPRLGVTALVDIADVRFRFDRMARQVPLDAPWNAKKAEKWDAQTFSSWIGRNVWTEDGRSSFRIFANAVFAAEPEDFSLLHALFYTHSGNGFDSLIGTHGGAQDRRFVGGPQQIAAKLAQQLGNAVKLSNPVRRIEQLSDRVRVVAERAIVEARLLIVAIPPTLAGRIIYDPALPGYRDQLTQRVPHGSVIKVSALYDTPFWREDDLAGIATCDTGPVKFTFDNSPPGGRPGVLLGYLIGQHARQLGQVSEAERRKVVLDCLLRYFGSNAAAPLAYHEKDWSQDEWTRGCYGAHFPSGVWTQYGPALRQPIGRIHWASTETATKWNGYMDGAVESGMRAAAEVLGSLL